MELLGEPSGYSGTSKSAGVTCGLATQMLLDKHLAITRPGVLAPYASEICDAIRERVEAEGIKLIEKTL
jgi:saccharopine dehydrogenase (NADP+, L-glutamate forming)